MLVEDIKQLEGSSIVSGNQNDPNTLGNFGKLGNLL